MNKTQWISLIKTIKNNLVSFIAIALFVACSVGLFSAMGWTAQTAESNIYNVFEDNNVQSYELLFPYGADEDDLEELRAVEGVDAVEGANVAYPYFINDGFRKQAAVYQLTETVSTPRDYEGELPQKAGEIAVEASWAKSNGISIGDTIKFESDDDGSTRLVSRLLDMDVEKTIEEFSQTDSSDSSVEDELYAVSDSGMGYLTTDEFTVTALVSPSFMLYRETLCFGFSPVTKKANDCLMFASADAFDKSAFNGYSRVLVHENNTAGIFMYDDEFLTKLEETQSEVEKVAKNIATSKYEKVNSKATLLTTSMKEELDEAKETLANAKTQLEDAEVQIAEGEAKLAKAKKQIEDGEAKIKKGEAKLEKGKKQVSEAKVDIIAAIRAAINENTSLKTIIEISKKYGYNAPVDDIEKLKKHLNAKNVDYAYALWAKFGESKEIYLETLKNLGISDEDAELISLAFDTLSADLDKARDKITVLGLTITKISEADATIKDGEKQLKEAKAKLAKAKAQYKEGEAKLATGKAQYEAGKEQYKAGLAKYKEGKKKYKQVKEYTKEIDDYGYSITNKTQIQSYVVTRTVAKIIKNTRTSMVALFIIVALMVCFSAIARLVNEEIRQIGTRKALGMKAREIIAEYMSFTGIALVIALIVGGVLAYFIIEPVLNTILGSAYTGGKIETIFEIKDFAFVSAINVVFLLGITWITVRGVIKRNTISLLNEERNISSKTRFYEKLTIYKKMGGLSQIIVNNCFNDRRRVVATVVGIAGCAALVVTAFAYSDIANANMDIQFSEYYHHNYRVSFDPEEEGAEAEIRSALDEEGIDNALAYTETNIITVPSGISGPLYSIVSIDDNFNGLITPVTDYGDEDDAYKGIWMSHSIKEGESLTGDEEIMVTKLDGNAKSVKPDGYLYSYLLSMNLFADKQSYENTFGTEIQGNTFLISTDKSVKEINEMLFDIPGYRSITDYEGMEAENFEQIESITQIMKAIYFVLSIALAVLVLLNLFTMFVHEKRKELTVLIINGYTYHDAKRYIYSDTIVLTIIGIIIGILVGEWVANMAVGSFESIQTIFRATFDIKAALIGAGSTAILTFLMSYISLRGVSKLDLTNLSK